MPVLGGKKQQACKSAYYSVIGLYATWAAGAMKAAGSFTAAVLWIKRVYMAGTDAASENRKVVVLFAPAKMQGPLLMCCI